jgi:hypothetical protein
MNNSKPTVHTIFFAELGVRQPFVARREVKQVPKKRQFFGSRWEWEGRTFSDPDVNERSENKRGENGKVV